ncbi:NAD-dependent epimerase/dehydratase family protein [Candidatus Sumerlaeota bacterium]|nr:NAD-dependent epimerase/dehydratase family protein [Candidatus Sumerlaeota bacterium]
MKCFVTGATGFVGGRLCEELRAQGHSVFALARATSNCDIVRGCECEVVEGSLDSINIFARHAESTDVFFHLAAITKALRREDFIAVNVRGTAKVLAGLSRGGFRGKFVLLSSLAAGGPAMDEKSPRREGDPDAPVSDYGRSKLGAEKVLLKRLPKGATWTTLRPGAIYGPREHEMLEIFRMMARSGLAVQLGPAVLTQMTHVEDVVDGLLRVASLPTTNEKTYYLNDATPWSFPAIVRLVSEALNHPIRLIRLPRFVAGPIAGALDLAGKIKGKPVSPFGRDKLKELDGRYWIADASRLEAETGWKPRWSLPEGLPRTIQWYRENGWL